MADETAREFVIEMTGDRRRRARDSILDAIANSTDQNMKLVLLLLHQVVEEIGDKIDDILSDKQGLRETVLNGHESVHHRDHVWIGERIEANCPAVCAWARGKMDVEAEALAQAKEDAKADKRAARDAFIRQAVTVLVSGAAGMAGSAWLFLK